MASLTALRAALAADLEQMEPGASWVSGVARTVLFPRFRAVVAYRVGATLAARHRGLLPVAYLLESRALRSAGAEISPLAVVGPGLCLVHSAGIVIGPGVVIGARARIHQGVTIGDGPIPGKPVLGDDVTVGAGASILGGVSVGSRARIGAGAVVVRDVPASATAVGVPATVRELR